MYKVQNFVGIDISRNFFDAALLVINEPTKVTHCRFDQNHQGYLAMQDWLKKNGVLINEQTLFCMEFTGIYNNGLLDFLGNQNSLVWVEMALRIKRSHGFSRSDTDRTDAIKIAQYAYRYQENMKLWRPVDAHLKELKHLMTQRDRIVRSITALSVPVNELKATGDISIAQQMEKLQSSAIKQLIAAQQKIETTIDKLVMQDQELAAKGKPGSVSKRYRKSHRCSVVGLYQWIYFVSIRKRTILLLWGGSICKKGIGSFCKIQVKSQSVCQ